MHTTAIIIVRRRKKGETTAYIRAEGGGRRVRTVWRGRREGGGGNGEVRDTGFAPPRHATRRNVLLEMGFGFKVASAFINFTWGMILNYREREKEQLCRLKKQLFDRDDDDA